MARRRCKYGKRRNGRCPARKRRAGGRRKRSTKLGRAMHQCKGEGSNFKRCVNTEMGL